MSRHFTHTPDQNGHAGESPKLTASGPRSREKTQRLPRLAVDIGEACEMLGCSRDWFDEYVRHELRWVRRGRRKMVAVRELERWLERSASRALDDVA